MVTVCSSRTLAAGLALRRQDVGTPMQHAARPLGFRIEAFRIQALLATILMLAYSISITIASPASQCNFGPTHHSHLVIPTANSIGNCQLPNATFLLSHGATFFCPHTYDVKLLATIKEDDQRKLLCTVHFSAIRDNISSKVLLRPTLPAGGLPALSRGDLLSWTSPVMYHIHSFGKDNSAGPDNGWNVTLLSSTNTTINVVNNLYGRLLDVQPRPTVLTYLVHNASNKLILSHYISTSGESGFDQLLTVKLTSSPSSSSSSLVLRDTWPTYLTLPTRMDSLTEALKEDEMNVHGELHVYNSSNGLPMVVNVLVDVTLHYYIGGSDGFAGYGTMCPYGYPSPFGEGPQSPTTCNM